MYMKVIGRGVYDANSKAKISQKEEQKNNYPNALIVYNSNKEAILESIKNNDKTSKRQ